MQLVILVPVLARPHRVEGLLDSIRSATTSCEVRVLFLTDPGDQAERDAVRAAAAPELPCGGSYAQKINAGISATTEALIFLGADDLRFHPGWFEAAIAKVRGTIGVVGTNDLGNERVIRGEHATHSLVARSYTRQGAIDGPALLHEGYRHNFCDQEFVETARHRRAFAFASDSHVEHLHPHWGKADDDPTYAKGQVTFRLDRKTYHARRQLWK